jgi:transaldolase
MKLFADVANLTQMEQLARDPRIEGFTTNPSLMRKAGITNYHEFADEVLLFAAGRQVSFEVIADDFDEMERQARKIQSWGPNVFVKIPIMNTKHETSLDLIFRLSSSGVQVNVTAVFTRTQIEFAARALDTTTPSMISVFAGRIADSGVDPKALVQTAVFCARVPTQIIWASTRELLNLVQARSVGCHIITVTPDLIAKMHVIGKDLDEYSLETVTQFYNDARFGLIDI